MKLLSKITSKYGFIEVFINELEDVIFAIPNGYVSPDLVRKDLEFLINFDNNSTNEWTYIVDVSKVKIIHPFNPFLLARLQKLSNMKEYIVYSPSLMVRLMIQLSGFISRPDRMIKSRKDLEEVLMN